MKSEDTSDNVLGLFTQDDACTLVDLLKLASADRAGPHAKEAISETLLSNFRIQLNSFC